MTVAAETKQRAFAVWWRDMERWVVPSTLLLHGKLPAGWSFVFIRDLVRQVTSRIRVKPDIEYKMAGVKWYGEGVFHRETVCGNGLSASHITQLVENALIYNRLFAWKASFAVVPSELAACYVSNEFPQFVTDPTRLLPEYLYLFCTLDSTIRAVNAASTGSSAVSRNRFKEEEFLNFEIPLPPVQEQRAVVARWRKAQDEIAIAQQTAETAADAIASQFLAELGVTVAVVTRQPKAFAVWWKDVFGLSVRATFLSVTSASLKLGKYPLVAGRDCLAEVRHGCSASPSLKATGLEVLKISAVTRGEFMPSEKKYAVDSERMRKEFDLREGDVLLCRTNGTLAYVGMSALVKDDMPNLIYPDKVIRVRAQDNILPEYLWQVLQSYPLRVQIEAVARTAVGNYAIGSEDIWNLQIPLPPLPVQKQIMERVEAGREAIAREKAKAERLSREINAEIEALILGAKRIG